MKNILKLTLIVALTFAATNTVFGQKMAYINSQELIFTMPEVDSVNAKLQLLETEFLTQLEEIQVEFNNKFNDWQKNSSTYTEAMNQMKEQELSEISQRFEQYQQIANQEIQDTQAQLMQPIYVKANNAIQKVAKDNGFAVVFDMASGPIIYYDESIVTNLLPLVYAELGIDPTAAAAKVEALQQQSQTNAIAQ